MTGPLHLGPMGDGATPLTPDEAAQLIATWVRTRGDLNQAEAAAIALVQRQYALRLPPLTTMLTEPWVRALHGRMLKDVWEWAGTYRQSDKNIGVNWWQVPTSVLNLVEDAKWWFDGDADEAATRLHHQMVAIHPFPDGNGRHSRLLADLCLRAVGQRPFTYGVGLPFDIDTKRELYYAALRAADEGDLGPLQQYVRS